MVARLVPLSTLVLVHSVQTYSLLLGRTAVPNVAPRCWMIAAEEDGRSRSADFLEEAKDEEELAYFAALDAAAEHARSPEALAAQRKAGEEAATAIRAALDGDNNHPIAKALAARGKAPATGKLRKALKKPKRTLAVLGEGAMMETVTLGGVDLNDPAYLSNQFRDGGCSAVCVKVEGESGLLAADAVAVTVAEQDAAKGEFPSPVPVVARGAFVDEVQLAAVAADGAHGVVLPLALNGVERTRRLMSEAVQLGLEPLLRVTCTDELSEALPLEPSMVVIGDCNLEEAIEVLNAVPEGILTIADVPARDVRDAWKVRDLGFGALISGRSLLEVCVRDRVPPSAIVKAILSKGSVKYGLGMQKGRLEGSKETLGSLSM